MNGVTWNLLATYNENAFKRSVREWDNSHKGHFKHKTNYCSYLRFRCPIGSFIATVGKCVVAPRRDKCVLSRTGGLRQAVNSLLKTSSETFVTLNPASSMLQPEIFSRPKSIILVRRTVIGSHGSRTGFGLKTLASRVPVTLGSRM
jgi:hypothetical protein